MIPPETKMKGMKQFAKYLPIILGFGLLTACAGSSQPYVYDDVYYSPSNDPVRQAQTDPRDEFNKTDEVGYQSYPNRYTEDGQSENYPEGVYQNRYVESEQAENAQPSTNNGNNQTVIINNNADSDAEYYDPEYAQSVERLNRPVQSFNTYDPFQRDRILYTADPFFYQPSLYGRYNFWDPFVPSAGLTMGWNSWSGWNVGLGIGFGYSAWACRDPFWNPWRPAFGYNPWNPWFPSYGWGVGYGWGYDPYLAGYNHGFYNGGGGFVDGGVGRSNRTFINTPRGSSGSRNFNSGRERAARPGTTTSPSNARVAGGENAVDRSSRPGATTREAVGRENNRPSSRTGESRETPNRYKNSNTRESYGRPEASPNRPIGNNREGTRTAPTRPSNRPATTQPSRPNQNSRQRATPNKNYSKPRYNNSAPSRSSSRPSNTRPQSRPSNSLRQSRPSYNNTPSYSPSRSGSFSRPSPSRGGSPSRSGSRPRR